MSWRRAKKESDMECYFDNRYGLGPRVRSGGSFYDSKSVVICLVKLRVAFELIAMIAR
jgi:hypothetical protein